jgi:hypothetical protein
MSCTMGHIGVVYIVEIVCDSRVHRLVHNSILVGFWNSEKYYLNACNEISAMVSECLYIHFLCSLLLFIIISNMYHLLDLIPCSLTRDPTRDTSKAGVCSCFFDKMKDFYTYAPSRDELQDSPGGWNHVVRIVNSISICQFFSLCTTCFTLLFSFLFY